MNLFAKYLIFQKIFFMIILVKIFKKVRIEETDLSRTDHPEKIVEKSAEIKQDAVASSGLKPLRQTDLGQWLYVLVVILISSFCVLFATLCSVFSFYVYRTACFEKSGGRKKKLKEIDSSKKSYISDIPNSV